MKRNNTTLRLTYSAILAVAYAALTFVLAPISYGPIQYRVSEALTIAPFFIPCSIWGLWAGCILSNLYTGSVLDIIFAYFGSKGNTVKNRVLGCLMPVLFNAVIVGVVLTWGYQIREFESPLKSYAFNALTVGLGEAGVLYLIGYPLLKQLPKIKFFREYAEKINGK